MRFSLLFCLIFSINTLAATTINTARGQVEIKDTPKKLAVFDVGVIDTLESLGVKVDGIPKKIFVDYIATNNKIVVGSLFEPSLEKLNALEPELIIVGTRSAKQLKSVKKVAPAIDLSLKGNNYFQESLVRTKDLGKLFNKEAKAEKIISELKSLRDKAREKSKNQGRVLMLLVSGSKVSSYGKKSRAGWLHSELNLNLIEDSTNDKPHGHPISFEYIAKTNPDWIIVVDRAQAIGKKKLKSAKVVLDNPLVERTKAWKNNQVIYLNAANIYIPVGGTEAMKRTLTDLLNAFSR